jgi:hypothetical protein
VRQRGNGCGGLARGVDQVFTQGPENAVARGQDLDLAARASPMTAAAVALITAVTPPDWA